MPKVNKKSSQQALQKAIKHLGGIAEMARALKVSYTTVWNWLRPTKQIPPKWVLKVEKTVDGYVTRYELRPDLYTED